MGNTSSQVSSCCAPQNVSSPFWQKALDALTDFDAGRTRQSLQMDCCRITELVGRASLIAAGAMLEKPQTESSEDPPAQQTNSGTKAYNGTNHGVYYNNSPRSSAPPQKSALKNGPGPPQDVRDSPSGTVEVSDGRHFIRYIGGIHAGDTYDGEFRHGVKHGYGTYRWASGDAYAGEYCDDLKHGRGMYSWANGRQCVAEYQQGKRVRTIVESEWRDGMWVLPPIPDSEQRHR